MQTFIHKTICDFLNILDHDAPQVLLSLSIRQGSKVCYTLRQVSVFRRRCSSAHMGCGRSTQTVPKVDKYELRDRMSRDHIRCVRDTWPLLCKHEPHAGYIAFAK